MLSTQSIEKLENNLNSCLFFKTNILLFEEPKEIPLFDKIDIVYQNNLDILDTKIIKEILIYLTEIDKFDKDLIGFYKHKLIVNSF